MEQILSARYVCESSLGREHIEALRIGEFGSLDEAKRFFDRNAEEEYERSDWKEVAPRVIERELFDTKSVAENKDDAYSAQTIYVQEEGYPLPYRPRTIS